MKIIKRLSKDLAIAENEIMFRGNKVKEVVILYKDRKFTKDTATSGKAIVDIVIHINELLESQGDY